MRGRLWGIVALGSLIWGCGSGAAAGDAGQAWDATAADVALEGGAPDSTATDTGATDAWGDATSTVPLAGFGTIGGQCGVITAGDLTATAPLLFQSTLDFGTTAYSSAYLAELSTGGQYMIAVGNLGGSSLLSEVFAYELLYRCELATLLKTEGEIDYSNTGGKKTDFLVSIDGLKIGVSVVRAYVYPGTTSMTVPQATTEITGKLSDIVLSSANVMPDDAWVKQILAVIAYGPGDAAAVATAWAALDSSVKGNTIVVVVETDGDDAPLYN